jgi:retinol-binding protein 3
MTSLKQIITVVAIYTIIFSGTLFAQNENNNEKISDQQKQAIINTALAQLKENYIFPERITKIESVIKKKFDNKEYSSLNTLFDFLEVLNNDFESSGNDHHLNIFYGPQYVNKIKVAANNTAEKSDKIPVEFVDMVKYENFFLKKVERMDGNIGYFKFNKFEELQFSKETIASAMNFLSNSFAIIFDLRENGGGSAETVHFLMSYFLPDSTKLGEFRRRVNNEVVELWTTKDPLIKKIPSNIPVYILVSKNTSSAAESFAYGLQHSKRVTVVGEQTHGEGNPGARFIINDKLYMMIPTAVNLNAVTGTNWDGVGVTPDIKTTAADALPKTIVEICQILANKGDNYIYKWMIPEYESQLHPEIASAEFINSILGNYAEGKKIIQENGFVYYLTESGKRKMFYMGNQMFLMDGRNDYRMRFPKTNKSIQFVEFVWNDGTVDTLKKLN